MPIPFLFQQQTGLAKVLNGSQFYAPRTSSITQTRGSGTPTITRATVATVIGYGPTAVLADGQTLLTVASGELRFQGGRRISEGVWSDVDAAGVPIPAATRDGSMVEAAATQYLGVTATPATQTTASLGTGTYTLWCEGSGSCIASAGTATITGEAAASAGSPNTFTVTGAGTVTVTVTGSLTTFNLTNTPYQTSYILNAGAAGTSTTRNKDVLDDLVAGNLTAAAGSVAFQWTPSHAPYGAVALCGSYVDASNYTMLLAQKVTNGLANSTDLTVAGGGWTATCTVADGVADPLGGTTAYTLTATGAGQYWLRAQNNSVVGDKLLSSLWIRRRTGTGTISLYTDAGTTNALSGISASWQRLSDAVRTATATNNYFGVLIATSGDAVDIWRPQGEIVTNQVSQFAGPYVATSGTATSNTFAILRKVIAGAAYDAYLAHAYASGTTYDIALYWGANGSQIAVDGTLGTPHANTDPAQLGTRWQWGADGNGGQQAGACFKEKYLYTRALSDSELQAVTA